MRMLSLFIGICLIIFGIYGFQSLADSADSNSANSEKVCVHSDNMLKSKISDKLDALGGDISERVRYAVQDGRIILIGYVKDETQHQDVLKAVAQLRGHYVNLYDHIQVRVVMPDTESADTAMTGEVKLKLLKPFNGVKSGDYAVTTFNGVVYVVGTADTQAEKTRVINAIKELSDKEPVEYINVRP